MQSVRRQPEWISPALREMLLTALQPADVHKPGTPAHEVFINVGYQKAQKDFRNILLHRTPIQLPPEAL